MLPNKGDIFLDFVEMNPRSIQAGPLIDQLMLETLNLGVTAFGVSKACPLFRVCEAARPGRKTWPTPRP